MIRDVEKRNKNYNAYVEQVTPKASCLKNCIKAFITGGAICLFAQILIELFKNAGLAKDEASLWTTICLVLASNILTGLNIYPLITTWGGAGSLVPITGFANSVAAPAIEYKAEGEVFGIGCKIFAMAAAGYSSWNIFIMDSRAIISACKNMDAGWMIVCCKKEVRALSLIYLYTLNRTASVVGEKESEGPLGRTFDVVIKDPMSGKDNWEQAESALQEAVVDKLLMKTSYKKERMRSLLSGDLLGQLIATSFGISKYEIPHFGIYGACSTFGEALSLGALIISAGAGSRLILYGIKPFRKCGKTVPFSS